jgi:hypothetical protein
LHLTQVPAEADNEQKAESSDSDQPAKEINAVPVFSITVKI